MKTTKIPSRIGTFDIETEGLFGVPRVIGWMLDEEYYSAARIYDWYAFAEIAESDGHVVWYAHNADFDFSYVAAYVNDNTDDEIDWSSTIFTSGSLLRVMLKSGIEVRDSMRLLPGTLDNVLKSWGTQTQKHHINWYQLGYDSLEDYYTRVPIDDAEYREYLKADVKGLYEVLHMLKELTGLEELKLTTASTAVEMYKQDNPENYELATFPHWSKEKDAYMREAYYGGRTEVFKPVAEHAYHYDVNSLYPYIMMQGKFPVGYPYESRDSVHAAKIWQAYLDDEYSACIVTATVRVPESAGDYPPLPYRRDGKLIFPVGEFTGTWVGGELDMACRYCDVEIVKVHKAYAWQHSIPIFEKFIGRMMDGKINSTGAKREFYKLIQNSLYGKFGQNPERKLVGPYTGKLVGSDKVQFVYRTIYGNLCEYTARRHSPFMQPHIAAFITSAARTHMLAAMLRERKYGNTVIYMDTDSLVLEKPMEKAFVDPTYYGAFKLESKVKEGIYLLPKLYAEVEGIVGEDGKSIIKAKGVPRDIRVDLTFNWYRLAYLKLVDDPIGVSIPVYTAYPQRLKFLRSVLDQKSPLTRVLTHKTLFFDKTKRHIYWSENRSEALVISETS